MLELYKKKKLFTDKKVKKYISINSDNIIRFVKYLYDYYDDYENDDEKFTWDFIQMTLISYDIDHKIIYKLFNALFYFET